MEIGFTPLNLNAYINTNHAIKQENITFSLTFIKKREIFSDFQSRVIFISIASKLKIQFSLSDLNAENA